MPFTVPLMRAATLFLAGSLSFSVCLLIVSDYKHTQFSNHLAGYVRVGSFPNPSRKIGHDSWMLDFWFHSLHIDLLLYSVCMYEYTFKPQQIYLMKLSITRTKRYIWSPLL